MHQIAKTAGIGQGTLYRRYAHKGDLCLDMLHEYGHKLIQQIVGYLDENKDAPAADRLGGLLDRWIDAIEEKADLIIAMESKMNCEDDRGSFFRSPMYLFFRDKISEMIAQMSVESNPAIPINADLAAHAIICSMSPVGYFHIKEEKGFSKEEMKQSYYRIYQFNCQ
jgi:AcrR family transcriptional regulator